jgi:hypothetical protein
MLMLLVPELLYRKRRQKEEAEIGGGRWRGSEHAHLTHYIWSILNSNYYSTSVCSASQYSSCTLRSRIGGPLQSNLPVTECLMFSKIKLQLADRRGPDKNKRDPQGLPLTAADCLSTIDPPYPAFSLASLAACL